MEGIVVTGIAIAIMLVAVSIIRRQEPNDRGRSGSDAADLALLGGAGLVAVQSADRPYSGRGDDGHGGDGDFGGDFGGFGGDGGDGGGGGGE